MAAGYYLLALLLIALAGMVAKLVHSHIRTGLFWCYRRHDTDLVKVRCGDCGGLGIHWLHGGSRQVLPEGNRVHQAGAWNRRAKLRNSVKCLSCGGMGFRWRAARHAVLPGSEQDGDYLEP